MADFLKLAQDAYEASSSYIDQNWRTDWEYALRSFRNEHASGSKYLSEEYKSRSRLYVPKTRSIIRKNEAAAAVALFSNMDVVNVEAGDPDNPLSVASAQCLKYVLEYRLTKTIPSFQVVLGGLQDAQTTGIVCSYNYWEFQTKNGKRLKDKPCIDLRPVENIRLDGGASWLDPVNTSPYFCDIIPMYVCDVRSLMNSTDEKTGQKFKKVEDSEILKARPDVIDQTRQARFGNKQTPENEPPGLKEFDTVWVMRWFMKNSQGDDYTYYTLGTESLFSDPLPLGEVYFHEIRPYVMGYCVLETHKPLKSGIPVLTKPLQLEANDIRNQRLDNVKFVLNKRWLVARGRQVDVQSLVRNVPGGVTLTTDPNLDVKESNWPDVTASAYMEQDRVSADFDELAGNFSPSTRLANTAMKDTLGGTKIALSGAGLMADYLIRTFVETWWEPVLNQLTKLERYYEDDNLILRLCAQKAKLFPRFGPEQLSQMIEMYDADVKVNVGMGSTNPAEKMQKFIFAIKTVMEIIMNPAPGMNVKEVAKEIFSMAGYRDGARFVESQEDPRLIKALQMLQQMKGALEGKQMELQANAQLEGAKIQSNERIKAAQLQVDQGRIQGDLQIRRSEIAVEEQKLQLEAASLELEKIKLGIDAQTAEQDAAIRQSEGMVNVELANTKLEHERQKLSGLVLKIAGDVQKAQLELEKAGAERDNESRIGEVAESIGSIPQELEDIKQNIASAKEIVAEIQSMRGDMQMIGQGMGFLAGAVQKKKPKGFRLNKQDGKTASVTVDFDDGSFEEMPVS